MGKPFRTWPALCQIGVIVVLVALCLLGIRGYKHVIFGENEQVLAKSLPGKRESAVYLAFGNPDGVYYRRPGKGRVSTFEYPSLNHESPPDVPFDKVLIYFGKWNYHYIYVNKNGWIFYTFVART